MLFVFGCDDEKSLGELKGDVRNGHNTLAYADVILYANGQEFTKGLTDSDGKFHMSGLPTGSFQVQGKKDGNYTPLFDALITGNAVTTVAINFKQVECLNGTVLQGPPVNPTNMPVVNLRIEVVDIMQNSVKAEVFTDAEGKFEVWDIPAGNYKLKMYHTTYAEMLINYSGNGILILRKVF
jgi:hypothetical protein